jgi:hypothetical protein
MTQQRVSPITLTSQLPATPTLSLQGAVGQSANLVEVKNSTGTVLLGINNAGQITPSAVASVGLVIKGLASQSGNLQEWQASDGFAYTRITATGNLTLNNNASLDMMTIVGTSGTTQILSTGGIRQNANITNSFGSGVTTATILTIGTFATTNVGLIIRGIASQTGNLQQWNSNTATLTAITSAGTINFQTGNTSATATIGAVTAPVMVAGYITMQVAGTTVKVPYYNN